LAESLSDKLIRYNTRLALYIAAETQILEGAQSYTMINRTLTRADLDTIADKIEKLENKIIKIENAMINRGIPVQRIVPRDH
jgi:hypothetical protein